MDRDDFWRLIDRLGPGLDVEALGAALARRSGNDISRFWNHLVECAAALNTQTYYDQNPVDVGDDSADPLPLGDDAFLDVRLAVVGHGRGVYEAVVADPSRFGVVWPFELGEDLVEAVGEAYEESTGDPWPALNPDHAAPSDLPRAPRHQWLMVMLYDRATIAVGIETPQAYRAHLTFLEYLVNEDRRWWEWWDQVRGEESVLTYEVQPVAAPKRRISLRTGHDEIGYDEVVVAARIPEAEFGQPPVAETPALGWAMLARTHFDLLFTKVNAKLGVVPPHPLPADTAELERQRKRSENERGRRANEEARAMEAWNRHRSSEHIWRGRAPDTAVDELIHATRAGQRLVALPQMIADLRADHRVPLAADDAERLAEAGYNPTEIAVALSDMSPEHAG